MATENETPTAAELEQVGTEAAALMVRLMQQNAKDAAYTANAVVEGCQRELKRVRAELAYIRYAIGELCSKPWTPHPEAILNALYPEDDLIQAFLDSADD